MWTIAAELSIAATAFAFAMCRGYSWQKNASKQSGLIAIF
jgi:hypothetical protein